MITIPHCGYIAIIGRPNVGKSTLLNCILGEKISITSRKPQTTRHRILGIKTTDNVQAVYVDTPGLHKNVRHAINRYMNRVASQAIEGVDVIGFVVEAMRWTEEDKSVAIRLNDVTTPLVVIVNKADQVTPRSKLLPFLVMLKEQLPNAEIVPLSAKTGSNVKEFEKVITQLLPENPHFFAGDQVTDRSERFLASEFIREKLMRGLYKELPYELTVEIEKFIEEEKLLRISAVIWIERASQKSIVIGEGGEQLKRVGKSARIELEKLFNKKIFLQLWVRVKENWSDDERAMQSLGYTD